MSTLYNFKIMKATYIYITYVWSLAFSYCSSPVGIRYCGRPAAARGRGRQSSPSTLMTPGGAMDTMSRAQHLATMRRAIWAQSHAGSEVAIGQLFRPIN